ncbi:hypothetical protein ACJMK2_031523 [Sinanodonta woodiana]|uniref:Mitochondria-eating protein n=1 Tax=Sinanodonta woodiana TaxID=1069815 RepID=A0ABD3WZ21_SINWO
MTTIRAAMISVWDWIRALISPLTWLLDHVRSPNNDKSQAELSARNKTIRRKQEHDTLLTEKEREVTKLRTENTHLLTRCTSLDKLANERELKVVSLTKDYKQLQLINEDLKSQNSTYNRQVITLQRDGRQLQTRNEDISRKLTENEEQVDTLKKDCSQLRTRNEELSRQLKENEQQIDSLKKECGQLRTRLSEVLSMQVTDGNPNITNLRCQNRSDKLAEHFAELYDNHWTDCYQILTGHLRKTEEETIHILLQIVQTSYDLCLDRSQSNLTSAKDLLFTLAGTSSGEHEKATDIFIQETLHKLKSFREKNFTHASSKIGKEIKAKLMSTIREPEAAACNSFIDECIRLCWMMCIKDPPMYIVCDKEAVFDQNKYMPYTKTGPEVSYVVWPALYLHRNGPLMREGVAQGESRIERPRNTKLNAAKRESLGSYSKQE